jgi:three-Cys-motif partner protein
MKKSVNSKNVMLEHSKAKVELYGRYLSKYLTILLRDIYTNNIYLYDLFCGAGIYENQGKGSPIVALDIIKDALLNSTSKTKIKVLFNDKEESKIESL